VSLLQISVPAVWLSLQQERGKATVTGSLLTAVWLEKTQNKAAMIVIARVWM